MPGENERKYVLSFDLKPEQLEAAGWKKVPIKQAYLPDGPRVRQYGDDFIFTYKRWIDAKNRDTEIETTLNETDFNDLWTECVESLSKIRYIAPDSPKDHEWSVDFLKDPKDETYFLLAEVEMPEEIEKPEQIHPLIAAHVIYEVEKGDYRFSNKMLSNIKHAKAMLAMIYSLGTSHPAQKP